MLEPSFYQLIPSHILTHIICPSRHPYSMVCMGDGILVKLELGLALYVCMFKETRRCDGLNEGGRLGIREAVDYRVALASNSCMRDIPTTRHTGQNILMGSNDLCGLGKKDVVDVGGEEGEG